MKRKPTKRTIRRPTRRSKARPAGVRLRRDVTPSSTAHIIGVHGDGGSEFAEVLVSSPMGSHFPRAKDLADHVAKLLNKLPLDPVEKFIAYENLSESEMLMKDGHLYISRDPMMVEDDGQAWIFVIAAPTDALGLCMDVLSPHDETYAIPTDLFHEMFVSFKARRNIPLIKGVGMRMPTVVERQVFK